MDTNKVSAGAERNPQGWLAAASHRWQEMDADKVSAGAERNPQGLLAAASHRLSWSSPSSLSSPSSAYLFLPSFFLLSPLSLLLPFFPSDGWRESGVVCGCVCHTAVTYHTIPPPLPRRRGQRAPFRAARATYTNTETDTLLETARSTDTIPRRSGQRTPFSRRRRATGTIRDGAGNVHRRGQRPPFQRGRGQHTPFRAARATNTISETARATCTTFETTQGN